MSAVMVRLARGLYDRVLADLRRPHPFAYERVGFLSARLGTAADGLRLVLLTDYHPVPDDQYVKDSSCGARINSDAIREAMQRVLNTGAGSFHVHLHEHRGTPWFSDTDADETPRVVAGLRTVGPAAPHGMLLLSDDQAEAWVWQPGEAEHVRASLITVVGRPMSFLRRE
jgi:hypothetical protein